MNSKVKNSAAEMRKVRQAKQIVQENRNKTAYIEEFTLKSANLNGRQKMHASKRKRFKQNHLRAKNRSKTSGKRKLVKCQILT